MLSITSVFESASRRVAGICLCLSVLILCRCYVPEPVVDYTVTVKIFTHARLCLWTYRINASALSVIKHPTGGSGPGDKVVDHALTPVEKDRFGRFLAVFPIDSLKDRYSDPVVTGNRHYTFDIRIGDREKHVYVYYQSQKDLVRLTGEIDRLLPHQYRIYYEGTSNN